MFLSKGTDRKGKCAVSITAS